MLRVGLKEAAGLLQTHSQHHRIPPRRSAAGAEGATTALKKSGLTHKRRPITTDLITAHRSSKAKEQSKRRCGPEHTASSPSPLALLAKTCYSFSIPLPGGYG